MMNQHSVNYDQVLNDDERSGTVRRHNSAASSLLEATEAAAPSSEPVERNLKICGRELNLNRSQLIALVLLSLYFFLTSCYYSLFAPFLPGEAIKKGISQTQVGIIFGIFQFVLLVLSPIFGKYMEVIGIRFLFVSGLFLSSGSEILFGFLNLSPDGNIYFIMCILCRIVTGIGSSMGLSYAIVGYYFPTKISSIVAMLEVFNGLGLMFGPPLGGFLYSTGGFQLPFFLMGGLLFVVFIIAFFMFPNVDNQPTLNRSNSRTAPLLPLLKTPKFVMTLMMLLMGSLSIGFIEPSIQLHLAPLGLTPPELGGILFIPSLLYVIVTPIVGYFCDKYPRIMPWFMFLSALSSGISFSFLGPIPLLNLPLKLWIFLSGFVAFGFSIGGLIIPVYSELIKIALENGYPNDLKTQGLISGVFSSIWSLGALVGPVIGGVVVDQIGFASASFWVVILFLSTDAFYVLFHFGSCIRRRSNRRRQSSGSREPNEYDDDEDLTADNRPLLV